MGANGSHMQFLPHLPNKQKRAALSQALLKKLEKRKKITKTIKKFMHHNCNHANKDQCKSFRNFLLSWTTVELSRLIEVYESAITLHQVTTEAASARCTASCRTYDLYTFMQRQINYDLELSYKDCKYYVHKAILATRSEYFNKLLKGNEHKSCLCVESCFNLSTKTFQEVLTYIYSDSADDVESLSLSSSELDKLCRQFGMSKSLGQTMNYLHDSRDYHDLVLTFAKTSSGGHSAESIRLSQFPCHSIILASRSQLLCNLIQKSKNNRLSSEINQTTEVVLDDGVVDHKYGPLLLKVIYQDVLDLSLMNSQANSVVSSSLSEAQAIVAGKSSLSLLEEVMELHHVGHFLELPILVDKCEEYLVQSLSPDNIQTILSWSQQPSGSRWVYREILQYIEDNFLQISQSPALYSLDESVLSKVLQSDFVQASEVDILQAVINWSEHQLVKELESQEPNLVTNTAHSLARKGIKSRDMDITRLREIARVLLIHVRQSHFIPADSEVVSNAIKRGLIGSTISTQGHEMAFSEPYLNHHSLYNHQECWIPSSTSKYHSATYMIPRAFMPFYEVARNLLEERTKDMSESEVTHLRRPSRPHCQRINTLNHNIPIRHSTLQNMTRSPEEEVHMPIEQEAIDEVILRTEQLLQTPVVLQALQACWDKTSVLKQVCLWAARELDCPEHIIYTIKANSNSMSTNADHSHHLDVLPTSLVPDLAPERLLLQHEVSASYENLTVHSVNSSPDVTLLSVRSYKNEPINQTHYPDVTIHSKSDSSNDGSLRGGACALFSQTEPKHRRHTVSNEQKSARAAALPELLSQHLSLRKNTHRSDCAPPDVLGDSRSPLSHQESRTVTSDGASSLHNTRVATLGSRSTRSQKHSNGLADSVCSSPRMSSFPRHASRSTDCRQSLLYSSLTRNFTVNFETLERLGPPPDIAPQPPRRITGTSTPPDVTSSPNNTWQAML